MKKILFVLAMLFVCSVSQAQTLTDGENEFIKICVEKNKIPYISYLTGNDYIFSVEQNDYVPFKATFEEDKYYKGLNKIYKKYNTAINKYACSYDDIMNNSLDYKRVMFEDKYRNEMIAGCVLVSLGSGIIAYNYLHWTNKILDNDFDTDRYNVSSKVTYIVGTCLIIDAIHTKNQSLRLGVSNLSYTYRF